MKKLFNFKDIGCLVIILLMAVQLNAQNDITPEHFQHDDKHFIGAHSNHKYFQEFINLNGHSYMYYNKTYNSKSKELIFYEIIFDTTGTVTNRNKLVKKEDDFSNDLHFDKSNYMDNAIFAVDSFIFVPVKNKKIKKMQMYRFNTGNKKLDKVELDHGTYYENLGPEGPGWGFYTCAISSGYDVLLFRTNFVDRYTFEKTKNNLVYKESLTLQQDYNVRSCESAVATTDNARNEIAVTALRNEGESHAVDFEIISINPLSIKRGLKTTTSFIPYEVRIALGRSKGSKSIDNDFKDGFSYISLFYTEANPVNEKKYKNEPYYHRCPIKYTEVAFDDNGFYMDDTEYDIVLTSNNYYAKYVSDALIDLVENYKPLHTVDYIEGNNGYQKQHILVSCDYKNETNFSMFSSDYYVINPNDSAPITDFSEAEYKDYKQMWTLLGIVDGAPPIAVNWPLWDSLHLYNEKPPSTLSFVSSEEQTKYTSINTQNSWSCGFKASLSIPIGSAPISLNLGAAASSANINQNMNELTNSITTQNFTTIELSETNQMYAMWYWAAPEIQRIAYSTYDWKDQQYEHPINDMIDYAFITLQNTLIQDTVPISDGPHYIFSPNNSTMQEWLDRNTQTIDDTTIASHALQHALSPAAQIQYVDHQGSSASISSTSDTKTTQSSTRDVSFDFNVSVKVPDIFKFGVSHGDGYTYAKSSSISSTFTKSAIIDFTNLTNAYHTAIYPQGLEIKAYFFLPDEEKWWYLGNPEFLGDKPWFLAYTAKNLASTEGNEMLALLEPFDNNVFYSGETINFIWNDELQNSKLIISKEPTYSLKSIIYHGDLNINSFDGVSALDVGDYYWRVTGISDNGEPVWSDFRKFSIVEKDIISDNNKSEDIVKYNSLPAVVYPNPTLNQNVTVTYEVKDELSPVEFILYDISGRKLWEKILTNQDAAMYSFEIPVGGILTHFGVLKVFNGKYVASKKIVVY